MESCTIHIGLANMPAALAPFSFGAAIATRGLPEGLKLDRPVAVKTIEKILATVEAGGFETKCVLAMHSASTAWLMVFIAIMRSIVL
jgi:hypothetical protein